jgi:hypothetical protein
VIVIVGAHDLSHATVTAAGAGITFA